MTRFLLELGAGWAFVGRQKELIIAGKTRKIDLLFYHIYLRCYVVIELKVRPFEPEYTGKLNFYVNAVNELLRRDGDNPSIGLLICRDMDRTEVQLNSLQLMQDYGVNLICVEDGIDSSKDAGKLMISVLSRRRRD